MVGVTNIDWVAVASVCAVLTLAALTGRAVETQVRRFFGNRKDDTAADDRLRVAVFGRPANPPYLEVPGLEKRMGSVEKAMAVLLARTESNHGSSLKDQLDAICTKLGIPVTEVSESQVLVDDDV